MHDLVFADAFRPPHFTVLGLEMLDLTIGHELLLWQRRNALALAHPDDFAQLTEADRSNSLCDAALICCKDAEKIPKSWAATSATMDLTVETVAFRDYRAAGSLDLPTTKMPRTSGVPFHYFGAPELARLINYVVDRHEVMTRTHFAGSPLNFPLGLARILYSTHLETKGEIWVQNQSDIEFQAQRAKFDAENPESTLAVGAEAVQAAALKWNAAHPDCPVPLMQQSKTAKN